MTLTACGCGGRAVITVEQVDFEDKAGHRQRVLRARQYGVHLGDFRSVEELAKVVDVSELVEEDEPRTGRDPAQRELDEARRRRCGSGHRATVARRSAARVPLPSRIPQRGRAACNPSIPACDRSVPLRLSSACTDRSLHGRLVQAVPLVRGERDRAPCQLCCPE